MNALDPLSGPDTKTTRQTSMQPKVTGGVGSDQRVRRAVSHEGKQGGPAPGSSGSLALEVSSQSCGLVAVDESHHPWQGCVRTRWDRGGPHIPLLTII